MLVLGRSTGSLPRIDLAAGLTANGCPSDMSGFLLVRRWLVKIRLGDGSKNSDYGFPDTLECAHCDLWSEKLVDRLDRHGPP